MAGSSSNTSSPALKSGWVRQWSTSASLVDDGSPAGIDQDGVVLHQREPFGIDEVSRGLVEHGVEADDVGLAQHVLDDVESAARDRRLAVGDEEVSSSR